MAAPEDSSLLLAQPRTLEKQNLSLPFAATPHGLAEQTGVPERPEGARPETDFNMDSET